MSLFKTICKWIDQEIGIVVSDIKLDLDLEAGDLD